MFLSRKLFTDASSAEQPSRKIGSRHYRPFETSEQIGQNVLRLKLPKNIYIHPVVYVEHTKRAYTQPKNITNLAPTPEQPFMDETDETVVEIKKILAHIKRSQERQFLALPKYAPSHEAK